MVASAVCRLSSHRRPHTRWHHVYTDICIRTNSSTIVCMLMFMLAFGQCGINCQHATVCVIIMSSGHLIMSTILSASYALQWTIGRLYGGSLGGVAAGVGCCRCCCQCVVIQACLVVGRILCFAFLSLARPVCPFSAIVLQHITHAYTYRLSRSAELHAFRFCLVQLSPHFICSLLSHVYRWLHARRSESNHGGRLPITT